MSYETPTIVDHGSLTELTAMMNVGGPVDTHGNAVPGHSCPTGTPGWVDSNSSGINQGSPPCVGHGSNPIDNPNNPGNPFGGTPPGRD